MSDPSAPQMSVIIPTHNRKEPLRRLLDSLVNQTLPAEDFEVVVVDDGSSDGTEHIAQATYPYALRYVRQENLGVVAARNNGALASRGHVLVFVDDDITLAPETLAALNASCVPGKSVAAGTLIAASTAQTPLARYYRDVSMTGVWAADVDVSLPFAECKAGLLAVARQDFLDLGMFQDPTSGGWPNWDDVFFGYRAHRKGLEIRQSGRAVGHHWDFALNDLATSCRRWRAASKSAVLFFRSCPEVEPHLPMFSDKRPIVWRQDPPPLIIRKLVRAVASSRPVLSVLELGAHVLERHRSSSQVLRPLYRWIIGGHIYRGFQEGLRAYSS